MASFENLATLELIMILAKFRNKDGYENMSRQQLESIFGALFLPKPEPKPRPKKLTPSLSQGLKYLLAHADYKPKTILGTFDSKYIEQENDSDEKITIQKYLENITPYLRGMIDDLKTSDE